MMRRATCIPASEQPEQDNMSRQRDGVIKGAGNPTQSYICNALRLGSRRNMLTLAVRQKATRMVH